MELTFYSNLTEFHLLNQPHTDAAERPPKLGSNHLSRLVRGMVRPEDTGGQSPKEVGARPCRAFLASGKEYIY